MNKELQVLTKNLILNNLKIISNYYNNFTFKTENLILIDDCIVDGAFPQDIELILDGLEGYNDLICSYQKELLNYYILESIKKLYSYRLNIDEFINDIFKSFKSLEDLILVLDNEFKDTFKRNKIPNKLCENVIGILILYDLFEVDISPIIQTYLDKFKSLSLEFRQNISDNLVLNISILNKILSSNSYLSNYNIKHIQNINIESKMFNKLKYD